MPEISARRGSLGGAKSRQERTGLKGERFSQLVVDDVLIPCSVIKTLKYEWLKRVPIINIGQ